MLQFLVHAEKDNVAVAVVDVKAQSKARCLNMQTAAELTIETAMDIPLGHKIALRELRVGDTIVKYGCDIGRVVAPVGKGEHVHNLKTKREVTSDQAGDRRLDCIKRTANGRCTAAEGLGHLDYVLTKLYRSA